MSESENFLSTCWAPVTWSSVTYQLQETQVYNVDCTTQVHFQKKFVRPPIECHVVAAKCDWPVAVSMSTGQAQCWTFPSPNATGLTSAHDNGWYVFDSHQPIATSKHFTRNLRALPLAALCGSRSVQDGLDVRLGDFARWFIQFATQPAHDHRCVGEVASLDHRLHPHVASSAFSVFVDAVDDFGGGMILADSSSQVTSVNTHSCLSPRTPQSKARHCVRRRRRVKDFSVAG